MDSLVDEVEMDLLLSEFGNNLELYFSTDDPTISPDDYFPDDLISDISILSEDVHQPVNPVESVSHDIPTYHKEWLVTDKASRRQRPPRLYEFLVLLLQKSHYESYASYKDKSQGIFEVHEPEKVADLWQQIKNRQSQQKMTYDKFARAIRWYYKTGIMKKTNARYTFQFSSKTLERITTDENNNIIINYPMLTTAS